ncbi:MAG: hypothetical protein MH252_17875 [Thermosynechococcaceae cyanobacterium MS004]|nr:hypothetical protein [Thermosynechococcaceae cyanobacterium MS004]
MLSASAALDRLETVGLAKQAWKDWTAKLKKTALKKQKRELSRFNSRLLLAIMDEERS